MRFHAGLPPETFEPTPGWHPLREPSPQTIARRTWPLAAALFGLAVAAWWVQGVPVLGAMVPPPGWAGLLQLAAAIVLLLVVHEGVHALAHPGFGCHRHSVLGGALKPLLLYASYDDALSRERFITILLAPFMVLSVAPCLAHAAGWLPAAAVDPLAALSSVNAALAQVDLFGAWLVARQVPRGATVRNRGWQTYWRAEAP